jgi:aryl-alcohol dehydrogenase-like predicted oxidoreductase
VRVKDGLPSFDGEPASGRDMRASVEASLSRLGTDYIDIYMLHGVDKESYIHAREELLPALHRLRDQGKLRFVGLSERFLIDSRHAMLDMACADDCWDVVMLGFNMINQSAARKILPALAAKGVGTLCMYAVRHALSTDENARNLVERLIELGEVDGALLDRADPFGFVVRSGHARSLADAAYRFCRHQPGIDVVLTGTGDVGHLRDNVRSINGPALPEDILRRLGGLFSRVESLSGD